MIELKNYILASESDNYIGIGTNDLIISIYTPILKIIICIIQSYTYQINKVFISIEIINNH
jgi:uncharacterized membrane protein